MARTPTAYLAHERFIAPARRRAELWRLIPAAAVMVLFYIAPLIAASVYVTAAFGPLVAEGIGERILEGRMPGAMLMMLYSFGGLALGTMAAVRLVHRRGAGTLFGPSARAAVRNFLSVALPLLGLQALIAALALSGPAVRPGLPVADFLAYLPLALPGILIQTGAEELLFRGYLQQQLAARFASPAVWMGVPSALFASGHYLPEAFGSGAIAIVIWAFVFGCLAADLTARTGNLGAALALHAANNAAAILLVGLDGNLDGLALWSVEADFSAGSGLAAILAVDFLVMICAWLLARLTLRC